MSTTKLPYETFRTQMSAALTEAGIAHSLEDRSAFIGVTIEATGHKVWVKRQKNASAFLIDTTVELAYGEEVKDNGKIKTRLSGVTLPQFVEHVLPRLADSADRLPAARRATKQAPVSSLPATGAVSLEDEIMDQGEDDQA